MFLLISISTKLELISKETEKQQDLNLNSKYIGTLATATLPTWFFILGGQVPPSSSPINHLSYHDVLGVHSAATLQGVHDGAVQLTRGWIVKAVPRQYSILTDSNFYARYTYGNRGNRGIKLSHWNAGNAHLENKTIDIENVISDHHPHLLGISEANLHKNHCIDNCKIADYDLIPARPLTMLTCRPAGWWCTSTPHWLPRSGRT